MTDSVDSGQVVREPGVLESDPPQTGIQRRRRDAELADQGWQRRFIGSPPRLEESKTLYESMGLEVLLDPVTEEELRLECAGCALALTLFRIIYTRTAK